MTARRSRLGQRAVQLAALILTALLVGLIVRRMTRLPPPTTNISSVSDASVNATPLLAFTHPTSPITPRTVWHFAAADLITTSPLVVGDLVYLVAGHQRTTGRVLALALNSGQPVWEIPLNNLTDYAPVVAGDLLYIGTRGGKLLALNRHTGEELWTFQGRFAIAGPPIVEQGVLYLGSEAVMALDAATGAKRWQRKLAARIVEPMAYADGALAVLAGSEFVLLDAGDGRRLLTFPLWFNPRGGVAISDATVAFTGDRAYVQALDSNGRDHFGEGSLRFWWTRLWLYGAAPKPPLPPGYAWQRRDVNGITGHLLAAHGGRFYVGVDDMPTQGRVVALASQTGNVLWERTLPALLTTADGAARAAGDVLVVGSGQTYVGLDATTGATRWTINLPAPALAAPTIADDFLLAPLENGGLYALAITKS